MRLLRRPSNGLAPRNDGPGGFPKVTSTARGGDEDRPIPERPCPTPRGTPSGVCVRAACGQGEPSPDPARRGGVEGDGTAVQFGDVPDNGEAEAGAGRRLVRAHPTLEDLLAQLWNEAGTVVVDHDHDSSVLLG